VRFELRIVRYHCRGEKPFRWVAKPGQNHRRRQARAPSGRNVGEIQLHNGNRGSPRNPSRDVYRVPPSCHSSTTSIFINKESSGKTSPLTADSGKDITISPPSEEFLHAENPHKRSGGGGWEDPVSDALSQSLGAVAVVSAPKSMFERDSAPVDAWLQTVSDDQTLRKTLEEAGRYVDAVNGKIAAGTASPEERVPTLSGDPDLKQFFDRLSTVLRDPQAAVASLHASQIMTGHLSGYGFDIEPVTPERQPVVSKGTTKWGWNVLAKSEGGEDRTLTISFQSEIQINGEKLMRNMEVLRKSVTVHVKASQQVGQVVDLTKQVRTIGENLNWLWTSVVIPIGLFFVGLRKRAKERVSIRLSKVQKT
jgi:hypothetical protein